MAYVAAARLNMDAEKALRIPLSLLGHLIANIAKSDGKSVGRKFSNHNAKEILKWGGKNLER